MTPSSAAPSSATAPSHAPPPAVVPRAPSDLPPIDQAAIAAVLGAVREQAPLVHCVTNIVVAN
ncbi:MAG: hypothetical protein LBQ06_06495, partial [Frankiaceae bacterium]|nr:hypothetical protein [Frankiaceae bacterium]